MTVQRKAFGAHVKMATASILLASTAAIATPASAAITISSDPILYWNDIANNNINNATGVASPVFQSRIYAMMNIAVYDAVNATTGKSAPSYLTGVTSFGGDTRAAAAQAAHDVLVALNPGNTSAYDAALASSLALVANGAAKANGVATGAAYAANMVASRATDGASTAGSTPYNPTLAPGVWRPTPPGNAPAAAPGWGSVKTFALTAGEAAAIHPAPPPALGSAEYAAAYNEVKEIGSLTSTTRTVDQTNSALFWDVANGGTWIRVALTIGEDEGFTTLQYASTFATLSTALVDAGIQGFATKYEYGLWRPITAIRLGDTDGNAATEADPNWISLFNAPAHPSYISTHSDFSAAGADVLAALFGDDEAFTFTIGGDTRTFTSLAQARLDAANSRLWGGIHFRFDNEAGLKLGDGVASTVLRKRLFAVAVPEPSSWAMIIAGFAIVGLGVRRRQRVTVSFA